MPRWAGAIGSSKSASTKDGNNGGLHMMQDLTNSMVWFCICFGPTCCLTAVRFVHPCFHPQKCRGFSGELSSTYGLAAYLQRILQRQRLACNGSSLMLCKSLVECGYDLAHGWYYARSTSFLLITGTGCNLTDFHHRI